MGSLSEKVDGIRAEEKELRTTFDRIIAQIEKFQQWKLSCTSSVIRKSNTSFYSSSQLASYYTIEFGEYIEDILTRFMNGENADESFIPNHYTPRLLCEQKIAWNDLYIQLSSNFWYSLTRNCLVISGDVGLVVYTQISDTYDNEIFWTSSPIRFYSNIYIG